MKNHDGFSTVELLVSLFVAAIFLSTGYQLYSMIIRDGGESRAQARASNAAYEYLLKTKVNSSIIKPICTPKSDPNTPPSEPINGLANVRIDTIISCPNQTETPSISKVEIILKYRYNSTDKQVVQATYAAI